VEKRFEKAVMPISSGRVQTDYGVESEKRGIEDGGRRVRVRNNALSRRRDKNSILFLCTGKWTS